MPSTDTQIQQLVVNIGTTEQIEAAIAGGLITEDMLSITTDGKTYVTSVNNTTPDSSGNVSLEIDALPSQTGQNGKYLTTDGTNASWGTVYAMVVTDYTT